MANSKNYLAFLLVPASALGQTNLATLPAGTRLTVTTPAQLPMRAGAEIHAQLKYPVYAGERLILPAHTVIGGHVVSLSADHARRVNSRLRADFTPFHTPVVRFDSILPPSGAPIPFETGEATDGAPIFRLVPTPATRGGIVGQYFQIGLGYVRDTINTLLGPDKGNRIKEFVYNQLPYHPEHIARDTAWMVETAAPLSLAPVPAPPVPAPAAPPKGFVAKFLHPPAPAAAAPDPSTWMLEAYLDETISSRTSHTAQAIHAVVAKPVYDADGAVAVPQGATLIGSVTQARPARRFARDGVLRFSFSELKLPEQPAMTVRTTVRGADSSSERQMAMDSEGQVKPKAQDKILIPALLVFLASQPFDRNRHMAGKNAVASSGLGLISIIVGTAAQQPNLAIGIGYYSAALSLYPRYIGRGAEVAFPRGTRIVIQTAAAQRRALHAEPQP